MPFSSQREAKQFLADKIVLQAQREGETLSEVDIRVLLFSVDEPESAEGIPEERLFQDDSDFEERVGQLFQSSYKDANPEEKKRLDDAIREINKGDHYIAVMARPVPTPATRARDLLFYVVIGIVITALSILYAMYR